MIVGIDKRAYILERQKWAEKFPYMIDSDRHQPTSLSQITVWFKGILKSSSCLNSEIYGRFIAIKLLSFSELRSVCVFILSHDVGQVCTSSELYIISNECKTSKFQAWNASQQQQNIKVPGMKCKPTSTCQL